MGLFPLAFVLVFLSVWWVAEALVPEITDTDYHVRLRLIRSATAAEPNRPLGVVLGSSRVQHAFQPERLPDAAGATLWVSAAHQGAGPVFNRLILHNLIRDGVRPAVVVIELMPTFFAKQNEGFVSAHLAFADVNLVRPYSEKAFGYEYHFLRHRLMRIGDISRVSDPFAGQTALRPRGGLAAIEDDITPVERDRRTTAARQTHGSYLRVMAVRPGADRALRDSLREAAGYGIRVVLLRTPEGPLFRSWYDPAGLAAFDAYVSRIATEFGADVIDARFWLDEGDFYDSHHTLRRGAEKFTDLFAREMAALGARGH